MVDHLIELALRGSRPDLNALHNRAVTSGELAVAVGGGGQATGWCRQLLDCFIAAMTFLAAIFAYLSGMLPPDWTVRRGYEAMMAGRPPI